MTALYGSGGPITSRPRLLRKFAAPRDRLQVLAIGSTTQTVVSQKNTFHTPTNISGGGGIASPRRAKTQRRLLVDANSSRASAARRSSRLRRSPGNISALVTSNQMGTANGVYDTLQANRGSMEGMFFFGGIDAKQLGSTGNVNYALRIEGNTIRDVNGVAGILLRSNQQDAGGQARLEATIHNNTMAEMGPNLAGGIYMQPGGASLNNDKGTLGANISNNTSTSRSAAPPPPATRSIRPGRHSGGFTCGLYERPSADPKRSPPSSRTRRATSYQRAGQRHRRVLSHTGAVHNQAFVLAVPSAMAPASARVGGYGGEPGTAPPRDPDPTPTLGWRRQRDSGGSAEPVGTGGGSGGSGGSGGGSGIRRRRSTTASSPSRISAPSSTRRSSAGSTPAPPPRSTRCAPSSSASSTWRNLCRHFDDGSQHRQRRRRLWLVRRFDPRRGQRVQRQAQVTADTAVRPGQAPTF